MYNFTYISSFYQKNYIYACLYMCVCSYMYKEKSGRIRMIEVLTIYTLVCILPDFFFNILLYYLELVTVSNYYFCRLERLNH